MLKTNVAKLPKLALSHNRQVRDQDAFAMTTISPAGAHRPPSLPLSATPLRSLKRQASTTGIGKTHNRPLKQPADDGVPLKRQKVDSPTLAATLPNPPSNDPSSVVQNADGLAQVHHTRRLPLELVDGFFVGSEGMQELLPQSPVTSRSIPPSLPQRPWKHSLLARTKADATLNNTGVRKRSDKQVQTVPYKTVPPRDGPRYMSDRKHLKANSCLSPELTKLSAGISDFAPWMGDHPEDVLNEQTVKHGFIDRIPVSQNETNTARQSLYGFFKHRSGLQTLSALFASVVDAREGHSKISSSSAFKPPPRVTLTEAKRKAWLTDLASPAVLLRKLSRTIPQGIRGQILLDQCVANSVPIGRALWFAKCVGANEIRTLKRKGTSTNFTAGAEIKWLRDWTSNVELFLESSIEQCGQSGWRPRMSYAFSLAGRLYSESLLDRDHYLDWIVRSLSSSTLERSPVWLLLVHLHRTDLVKYRKRGGLLARSLLEKLRAATEPGQAALAPLVERIKRLVRSIIRTNLVSFVMPHAWRKYQGLTEKCLELSTAPDMLLLEQLSYRNERLITASTLDSSDVRTPRQLVITVLDSARPPFDILLVAQECRSACLDMDILVNIVLEWGTSRFRAGQYGVYLAVGLIATWHNEVDINLAVIDFLALPRTQIFCDTTRLHMLVSEMVRSQVFSLSRYLQWLTARGGLQHNSSWTSSSALSLSTTVDNGRSESWTGFGPVQILRAVPLASLNPAVKNFRDIVLARAGFSVDHEANLIEAYKSCIAERLPRISSYEISARGEVTVADFSRLSWSAKLEMAHFLKQHIKSFQTPRKGPIIKDTARAVPVSTVTDAEFRLIRSICEDLGDFSTLVEIIKICITSEDQELLASITDTVNFHLGIFSAIGAFADLHATLFRAYLTMRTSTGLPRQFITSLISIGSVVSSNLVPVSSLQQDLARGDRNLAVAACSPVSDGMAESLQQAGPAFTEEFEAVLSTGNRMEEQTMTQLFYVLAERLEKGRYQTPSENDEILCALFARLRIYRIAQFDTLIAAWLPRIFTTTRSCVKQLLPILISTSCISFRACVDTLLKILHAKEISADEGQLVRTHLTSFLATIDAAENDNDAVLYRIKLENTRHIEDSPERAFELRVEAGASNDGNHVRLSTDLVIHLVLKGLEGDRLSPTGLEERVSPVLDNLLQLPADSSNSAFPELVEKTTDLSIPFCRLRLQLWAAANLGLSPTAGQEAVVDTLFDLAKTDKDNTWIYYTKAVGLEAACQIRERAEEAFFALPIFPGSGRNASVVLPVATCVEQANNYLRIISRTAHSIPPFGVQTMVPMLIERFAVVLRGLIAGRMQGNNDNAKQATSQPASTIEELTAEKLDLLASYLTLLLWMTSLHRTAFVSARTEPLTSPIASPKQTQQDLVKILVLLANVALHPGLQSYPALVSHIFDIAATIVDDASEEVRTLCARILRDKMRDQRAEYLFGSANNIKGTVSASENTQTGWTTEGLQIMKDGKRVGEYRSRNWEMLEGGAEPSISLSLFDTRKDV